MSAAHSAPDRRLRLRNYGRAPTVHCDVALVAAAVEAIAPFDHADASLASGALLLAVAEPALFLLAFAFGAFGRAIGNADAFDAFRLRCSLVFGGVECSVRCPQIGCTAAAVSAR
jgi:hypothetical protein